MRIPTISVRCPICEKLWDMMYDERTDILPAEEKCPSCIKDEYEANNQHMLASDIDMIPGDY